MIQEILIGNAKGPQGPQGPHSYTYIIDSDAKLAAWADNAPGNDYSRVLIKAGTWTLNTANRQYVIDIRNGRTKCVVGEPGSKIVINNTNTAAATLSVIVGNVTGSYPDFINPGKEYFFFGVTVEAANNLGSAHAFRGCANLTNCTGMGRGGDNDNSGGFYACMNLANCTGTGTATGNGHGFRNCANLANCTGTGTGTGIGNGHGFYACMNLTNCIGTGTGTSNGYGFFNCANLTNCTGTGTG